jgi:hypothetical protein
VASDTCVVFHTEQRDSVKKESLVFGSMIDDNSGI